MAFVTKALTSTGSNGSATASGTTDPIDGVIMSVKVAYGSQPATTDVTIAENGGLGRTILTLTNNNTTVTKNPRDALHDSTGTSQTGQWVPFTIGGFGLSISVAQGDNNGTVTVSVDYIPNGKY